MQFAVFFMTVGLKGANYDLQSTTDLMQSAGAETMGVFQGILINCFDNDKMPLCLNVMAAEYLQIWVQNDPTFEVTLCLRKQPIAYRLDNHLSVELIEAAGGHFDYQGLDC